jgi:uncharacterized protein YukE
MARYRVESAALSRIVNELEELTAFANEIIAGVEQTAASVSAEWTGQANQQYLAAHAEWVAGAQQMTDAAAAVHQRAATAAANYDALASHLRAMWS